MRSQLLIAAALLGLSACATAPSDVNPDQQAMDQLLLDARQARLNGVPAPGVTNAANGQISTTATAGGVPVNAGATGDVTFLDPNDIGSIAAGAIAEAEAQNAGPTGGVFDNLQPQQASDVLPAPLIPRVAAFAIRTTHQPGQRQWRRNPFRRDGAAACSQFESRDLAQDRFLAEGGPERDPLGLDPDGDGFVCGFDPRELRAQAAAPAAAPVDVLPPIDG